MRKRLYWKLPGQEILLGASPLVAAIIPVTPEPALDGESYLDSDRAYARALKAEEEGAHFIELTGETLRAGTALTSEETQLHRLVPVLKKLHGHVSAPLIVRTRHAGVARRAIELGAQAIHDPSALTADLALAKEIADTKAGLILGHMKGAPEAWARQAPSPNPIANTTTDLQAAVHRATRANVARERIMIDPGLGLGKRREENASILAGLGTLGRSELPFSVHLDAVGMLTNEAADTDAATIAAVLAGTYLIGVFGFARTLSLIAAADAIANAAGEPSVPPSGGPQLQRTR